MRYKNVTALYKGKGPRMLLDSDRGIFTSNVLSCILQKLLLPAVRHSHHNYNIGLALPKT